MRRATGRWVRRVTVGVLLALVVAAMAWVAPPVAAAGTGSIEVTVAGPGADAVPGAMVAALHATTYVVVGADVADGSGEAVIDDLAPGSYRLHVIDPSGAHQSGFAPASPVDVVADQTAVVQSTLAPALGSVEGTVLGDGGSAVPGAWVAVLDLAMTRIRGAEADGDGEFEVEGLLPGEYAVVALDPSAQHQPRFFDGSPDPVGATAVTVTAGGAATADFALPSSDPAPSTGEVSGQVTGDGTPLEGAWVAALRTGTLEVAGGTTTGADGSYQLDLPAGNYVLEMIDPTGAHGAEWHEDVPFTGLQQSTPVTVGGGAVQVDADLALTTGSVAGTVTEHQSDDPLPGAWVVAIGPEGSRAAVAAADGSYRIDGLPAVAHLVTFVDPTGVRPQVYWPDAATYAEGDPVSVTAGQVADVDGVLRHPGGPAHPTPVPGPGWSTHTIAPGGHSATVQRGASATQPLTGFTGTFRTQRRYHFAFDSSARYVITNPTQPEDQLDWNKLPGLSDCGDFDLAQNGWMFGWRWRLDLTPRVLEITAYANNDGTHLWPNQPLVTLTQAQVDAQIPLWFEMSISPSGQQYQFRVQGPGGRDATATLPRACTGTSHWFQWAGGFYFGGTSAAPTQVTGLMNEVL